MATDAMVTEVQQHVGPMTAALDEAVAYGIAEAERRNAGIDHRRFGYLRSGHVRAHTRLMLERDELPDGWQFAGNEHLQGQLILRKPGVMDLRLLKQSRQQPGRVPHAGHSHARRAAWLQDPLPTFAPIGDHHSFLLLWDYMDPDNREDGFTLRLVHPVTPGAFKHQVRCDLDLTIPRGGTSFEHLRFDVQDDEEDLFAINVDKDEEGFLP